jgi:hypothetical protein
MAAKFAHARGWSLDTYNIMVEGVRDVDLFRLADRKYSEESRRTLLSNGMTVFAAGTGDDGGTSGIVRYFSTLKQLIDVDLTEDGRRLFRVVALLDDDTEGQKAHRILTGPMSHNFRDYYDVFLLRRVMPRTTREPSHLARLTSEANSDWKGLDCVIEDLLSGTLLELFVNATPSCLMCDPKFIGERHHYKFHTHAKAPLFRFAEENGNLDELRDIAEILMAFRYYFGLDPDGDAI